jgi:hypothetical protein
MVNRYQFFADQIEKPDLVIVDFLLLEARPLGSRFGSMNGCSNKAEGILFSPYDTLATNLRSFFASRNREAEGSRGQRLVSKRALIMGQPNHSRSSRIICDPAGWIKPLAPT